MYVLKRNGQKEKMYYDKITARNTKLACDLNVDTSSLSQSVIKGLASGMTTRDVDKLSCESAIYRSIYERDYGILASRIAWNDLHKTTPFSFKECITLLYNNVDKITNKHLPLMSKEIYEFALKHIDRIESVIDYSKDYNYDYFSFKLLEKSYLLRVNGKVVERLQSSLMREALGIHGPSKRNFIYTERVDEGNIDKVIETYIRTSNKDYTHATPTKFNAGTTRPQMSSCYLLSCPDSMGDDLYDDEENIDENLFEQSIPDCWKNCAKISKLGGGIGVDVTLVRPRGSHIGGTNGGVSGGIIPLVRVFNNIARYVDQSGKRKGAIALYLQPWHPDTPEFLEIRLKTTGEESSAKDIFPALWCPRLLFKRIEDDEEWNFFDPHVYPELVDLYGDNWEKRYIELENTPGASFRKMKARTLWEKIIKSLDETGLPYMHNKDEVNEKNNQKEGNNGEGGDYTNLVSIRSSNLCCEINERTLPNSIAVCNLISVCLSRFVNKDNPGMINWDELGKTVEIATDDLNKIIDKNYYPVKYCADNNFEYRPIGIGIQDLAGAFASAELPWEKQNEDGKYVQDSRTKVLNQLFSECMYYHALKRSNFLAKLNGPYKKFSVSPSAKGILQYDMWKYSDPQDNNDPLNGKTIIPYSHKDNNTIYSKISSIPANKWNENNVFPFTIPTYDWEGLKQDIVKYGLFNSLLIAPMPTATTSQILGNNEGFEPYTSNIYSRKGIAGDFPCVNNYLARDLENIGKWTKENINKIMKNNGSVQGLDIPNDIKDRYRTAWEISQKVIIDFAADRGAFCDQSQSMNLNIERPTPRKVSSIYNYIFKKGLKTMSYYLRSLSIVDPIKFTIMDQSDPIQLIKDGIEKERNNEKGGKEEKI